MRKWRAASLLSQFGTKMDVLWGKEECISLQTTEDCMDFPSNSRIFQPKSRAIEQPRRHVQRKHRRASPDHIWKYSTKRPEIHMEMITTKMLNVLHPSLSIGPLPCVPVPLHHLQKAIGWGGFPWFTAFPPPRDQCKSPTERLGAKSCCYDWWKDVSWFPKKNVNKNQVHTVKVCVSLIPMSTRRKRVRKRRMEKAAIDTPKISPIEKLILAHKDSPCKNRTWWKSSAPMPEGVPSRSWTLHTRKHGLAIESRLEGDKCLKNVERNPPNLMKK